jgi:hypothetical protein
VILGIVVFLVVGGLWFAFLALLPEPRTWAGLSATSEYVGYRVIKPSFVAFHAGQMRLVTPSIAKKRCVDGLVEPQMGAYVEYRRGDKATYEISITPKEGASAAKIYFEPDKPTEISEALTLVRDDDCKGGLEPSGLPIFGPAVFGSYTRAATSSGVRPVWLLKGAVRIYALAQRKITWMSFPPAIYLLSEFDLPAGAVLCGTGDQEQSGRPENCDASGPGPAPADGVALPYWTGTASPAPFDNGFDVAATSSAPALLLSSSAAFGGDATQRIDLGAHDQFLKDPNILWLQLRFGIFLFLLHSAMAIGGFFFGRSDDSH